MKQTVAVAGLISQTEMKYRKVTQVAQLTPTANQ